jgi:hypothetical protein
MRHSGPPFAIFKPAFWGQKDKNQDDQTQPIPLPGVAGIVPKKQLFENRKQLQLPSGFRKRWCKSQAGAKDDTAAF